MRVAVLVSGGKDSTLTLHQVLKEGYDVQNLVCMIPQREDSWMFHYLNIHLIDLFAEAVNIPLAKAKTLGIKEKEVEDLKGVIETLNVQGIASGTISSRYQKNRIEGICKELRLECVMPLWNRNPLDILMEILKQNFEVIITGVYAYGFSPQWLGRKIDETAMKDLIELNKQNDVSLIGEGGEYETLVLDAPFFQKKIKIIEAEKIWEGQNGYVMIKDAKLETK